MGSDFANSNVYKALPNALKRRDDRRITLKSAATNEVGEDGIAKDTYDYSKWKVLPKSKAKIHGWVWNSDTMGWHQTLEAMKVALLLVRNHRRMVMYYRMTLPWILRMLQMT